MAQNITLLGADYPAVPSVLLPKTGGGTASFVDTSDANATASDIVSGKTAYVNGQKITGSFSGGAVVVTEETAASGGIIKHITADVVVSGTKQITTNGTHNVSEYSYAEVNVPTGSTINNQNKTVTPTTSQQTVTADSGYTGLGTVTVNAMPTMTLPTSASSTSSGTSKATIGRSTSAQYINIPTGYNSAAAYYTISATPNGSATASATKGTVSNHSITVTPSVTRTAGYITAGTSNGTAVTVSASELVSGSETKTANGTYDVTNLASLVVAVPLQHIYTGTSAPSSSLGSNGDVYIQTT